ncbi:hypothetical protein [Rhodovulum sp. 12E13]|uniref:hypothetical protein n=1 Tax=Rhodovulum sp. 12E13 TaxID=2203891 RepID=UPI00131476CB|nr:hypothetical protein [Rhodovulum sp. 12E13]
MKAVKLAIFSVVTLSSGASSNEARSTIASSLEIRSFVLSIRSRNMTSSRSASPFSIAS